MKYAQPPETPLAPKVSRNLKGSFDYVAFRYANRNSAQDDKP